VVVVVSALCGVTDELVAAVARAEAGEPPDEPALGALFERHRVLLEEIGEGGEARIASILDGLRATLEDLRRLLAAAALVRECSPRAHAAILATGERLSAPVFAAGLEALGVPARAVDATALIVTDDAFREAAVDFEATRAAVEAELAEGAIERVPVVTGFLGRTKGGLVTLLGRGGSDYSAAILGHALHAERVEIWTDVDGVMTADPRHVEGARTVPVLSYAEAAELARAGAKVLHPRTLAPLVERGIPVVVRNTVEPAAPATRVHAESVAGLKAIALGSSPFSDERRRLALVGEGLGSAAGLKAHLVLSLEREGVAVRALVEEADGLTLVVEVERRHAPLALNVLHAGVIESGAFAPPSGVWETAEPCPSFPKSRSRAGSSCLCSSDGPSPPSAPAVPATSS
jgi:aspartate kinase